MAQVPNDPFPAPIPASEGVIRVAVREFASVPDVDGQASRMMLLVDEPVTKRLFVNDMRGPLYVVSYDGGSVARYLDINAEQWGVAVQPNGISSRCPASGERRLAPGNRLDSQPDSR